MGDPCGRFLSQTTHTGYLIERRKWAIFSRVKHGLETNALSPNLAFRRMIFPDAPEVRVELLRVALGKIVNFRLAERGNVEISGGEGMTLRPDWRLYVPRRPGSADNPAGWPADHIRSARAS